MAMELCLVTVLQLCLKHWSAACMSIVHKLTGYQNAVTYLGDQDSQPSLNNTYLQWTFAMPNKGAWLQAMVTGRCHLFREAMPQPVSRKGLLALTPLGGRGPGHI